MNSFQKLGSKTQVYLSCLEVAIVCVQWWKLTLDESCRWHVAIRTIHWASFPLIANLLALKPGLKDESYTYLIFVHTATK